MSHWYFRDPLHADIAFGLSVAVLLNLSGNILEGVDYTFEQADNLRKPKLRLLGLTIITKTSSARSHLNG